MGKRTRTLNDSINTVLAEINNIIDHYSEEEQKVILRIVQEIRGLSHELFLIDQNWSVETVDEVFENHLNNLRSLEISYQSSFLQFTINWINKIHQPVITETGYLKHAQILKYVRKTFSLLKSKTNLQDQETW